MIILGLTGSIASGKSSVAFTLRKYFNAKTLDIDDVTHQLIAPNQILYNLYLHHFGNHILNDDHSINKKKVADIIFNDKSQRQWINSVAHPILLDHARNFLVDCQAAQIPFVALEVPLLFDAGWQNLFDQIWCVYVPFDIQMQRLMARDQLTYLQARRRIKSQYPVKRLIKKSHVAIRNFGYNVRQQIFHAAARLLP
ncbi:MAG: dephospho-CoA kinase [Selenomonadaceae bacterium]|nr:dephospho-CoA kinase [Selenomonadaceae bacterium]